MIKDVNIVLAIGGGHGPIFQELSWMIDSICSSEP
jgi:hypothetical protein